MRHQTGPVLSVDMRHGLGLAWRCLLTWRMTRARSQGGSLHPRVRHGEYPRLLDQGSVVVDGARSDRRNPGCKWLNPQTIKCCYKLRKVKG